MNFISLSFAAFLLPALCLTRLAPDRFRWLPLLGASIVFYALLASPGILAVFAAVIVTTWYCGVGIGAAATASRKRLWLTGGILALVLLLICAKYLPFLRDTIASLTGIFALTSVLPEARTLSIVGVSYFVFQAIAYLTDIYLEIMEPEHHMGRFALYMSFFPKVIQGPIERGESFLPQTVELAPATGENLRFGLSLFVMGMVKKVVIADRLALLVDPVYTNPDSHYGITLVMATYLFAFQLYFDFSGYTDMALGIARLCNIRLTQNFNTPYRATSLADFWRRWHISFSRWILDYLFKPLQMRWRDRGTRGTAAALLVTFLVSGIWHGASWGFVVWGLLHGTYLAASLFWKPYQKRLHKALGLQGGLFLKLWQTAVTFNLVCFAWIFFRAASLTDALRVVVSSCRDLPRTLAALMTGEGTVNALLFPGGKPEDLVAVGGALALMALLAPLDPDAATGAGGVASGSPLSAKLPLWAKGALYGALFYLVTSYGTSTQSFIYQQF